MSAGENSTGLRTKIEKRRNQKLSNLVSVLNRDSLLTQTSRMGPSSNGRTSDLQSENESSTLSGSTKTLS